jgi:hypothetical protein
MSAALLPHPPSAFTVWSVDSLLPVRLVGLSETGFSLWMLGCSWYCTWVFVEPTLDLGHVSLPCSVIIIPKLYLLNAIFVAQWRDESNIHFLACEPVFSILGSWLQPSDCSLWITQWQEFVTENWRKKICRCNTLWRPIGLWNVEAPTHFLDSQFTDGAEVVNLRRRPPFTTRKIPGGHLC